MRYTEYSHSRQLLEIAFDTYKRNNIVRTQESFSKDILGQSPAYYETMIAHGDRPSLDVLETLLSVTKTMMSMNRPGFAGDP